jgi:hypothetical protein
VFCGMMDGLAFLPVLDLTNGVHEDEEGLGIG